MGHSGTEKEIEGTECSKYFCISSIGRKPFKTKPFGEGLLKNTNFLLKYNKARSKLQGKRI